MHDEFPCRLYLALPPLGGETTAASLLGPLSEALESGEVPSLLLDVSALTPAAAREALMLLTPVAQSHGTAMMVAGHPDVALSCGCDGIHIDGAAQGAVKAVKSLRAGNPAILIGFDAGLSRHAAMEAGEAGADVITFSDEETVGVVEACSWWVPLFEVPCVAGGHNALVEVAALAASGADFVLLGDAVWRHPGGPAAGVQQGLAALTVPLGRKLPV
ncbi:thiamine phosphate synthase [Radicibacter daui]|uniref:thiamine phosphate synthase n=1 Tax=Radicibacter daui TaxID=3064829 RepID=UPI004046C070